MKVVDVLDINGRLVRIVRFMPIGILVKCLWQYKFWVVDPKSAFKVYS